MNIEDLVAKLRQDTPENPIAWMVGYEDRPIQVEPSVGAGPHLLLFTEKGKADRFIELRKKHYHSESLVVDAVDTVGTVKKLATLKARDPDYAEPPCGILFDFNYDHVNQTITITPQSVEDLTAKELGGAIKELTSPTVSKIIASVVPPAPEGEPKKPEPAPSPSTPLLTKGKGRAAIPNPPPLPSAAMAAAAVTGLVQPPVKTAPSVQTKPGPAPATIPAKVPVYQKGGGRGWIKQGKTLSEKLAEQRTNILGGANTRKVSFTQVINLAKLIAKNEPGTFSMFVVDGEPHLLAKLPPPPAEIKDILKKNVKIGTIQFRATHYEYPTFPAVYCRLFIPLVKDFKPGQTKGTMAEALTIFTEANFQEWVDTVEKTHTSKVIMYGKGEDVLAKGSLSLPTESILFLVQEVDSANKFLSKIPEAKRDFNAASIQFFKEHPEPFWDEPAKSSPPPTPKPQAAPVVPPPPPAGKTPTFFGKRTNPGGTYEDYHGTDAESAKEFLLTKRTSLPKYYIRVETSEGNWGMDKEGLYLERLLPWQLNVSSAKVEGKHGFPGSMFGVIMTKKGIVDNFVVEVVCGKCGHEWQDGLRYQNTTVVKCPKCKTLNKVDTTNIEVFG